MMTEAADARRKSAEDCATMRDVRYEIDRIDRALVRLIAERVTYIEAAGRIKADRTTVRDAARIEDVVDKVLSSARAAGLPASIAEPVWRTMIERCIAHEFEVWDEINTAKPRKAQSGR